MGNKVPSSEKILEVLRSDYSKGEKLCQRYGHLGFDPSLRKAILTVLLRVDQFKQELAGDHEALRSFEAIEKLYNENEEREEDFSLQMREATRLSLKGKEEEERYARLVGIIRTVFRQLGWPDPRCGCSGLVVVLLLCFAIFPTGAVESSDEETVWFALAVVHRQRYLPATLYFAKEHLAITQAIMPRCLQVAKLAGEDLYNAANIAVIGLARGGWLKDDALVRYWDFMLSFGGHGWAGMLVAAARSIEPETPWEQMYQLLRCENTVPHLAQAAVFNLKHAAFLQSLIAQAAIDQTSPVDRRLIDVLLALL